ncbi:extracellular calcium-sensing receptor-like [Pleurodeles waltl]|uniref:extracellular calcium-sensing receptor-like n=1 Tax=Pleurodeles waltl TaxID=8319 RepID=UPI003709C0A3
MGVVLHYVTQALLLHENLNLLGCQYGLFCAVVSSLLPTSFNQQPASGCQLKRANASGFTSAGNILIGGIFPVHDDQIYPDTSFTEQPVQKVCQLFSLQTYQRLQAMVFAIEEINKNLNILPNVTLGFRLYDSCAVMQKALEGMLWILTQQAGPVLNYQCQEKPQIAAIVGPSSSTHSIVLARILGLRRYPQISYFSTSPLLSDRNQFPSFFRTIPSDDAQSRGLAQLVMHFGWTWVGILALNNDYGQHGAEILQAELAQSGVCVAFSESIVTNVANKNAFHIAQVMKNSTANVIVVFSNDANFVPIVDELLRQNVTGKVWIASEAWSTSSLLSKKKYYGILAGTIGFAVHSGEIPGFSEHLNNVHPSRTPDDVFIKGFWEGVFGCKVLDERSSMSSSGNQTQMCTGAETFKGFQNSYSDVKHFEISYNVFSAVYVTAYALHGLNACKLGKGPFIEGTCADVLDFQPWQVLHYIKSVQIQTIDGARQYFDERGNPPAQYDVINWQLDAEGILQQTRVGSYGSTTTLQQSLVIDVGALQWVSMDTQIPASVCSASCLPGFRKNTIEGEPTCCFNCIACPEGEISNQTDSIKCHKCPQDHWPNKKQDGCLLKEIEFLTYEEPVGAFSAIIVILLLIISFVILTLFILHRNTPIIKANNRLISYILLLALMMCFFSSLPFIGYPSTAKCLLRQATFGISFALCVSCILAKTIMVVIAFNATKPHSGLRKWVGSQVSYTVTSVGTLVQILFCISWLIFSPPFSQHNTHTKVGKIIIECNEGSQVAFWCMLGYLWLLATISFIMAFLARKLPNSFNEAKFITFSMLAFLSVWVSFIPAYLSTSGKYMVAMEIFAILSSGASLLFCIFLPKCYIIVFRHDMNTKEYLMSRGTVNKCD